ncbi:Mln51-like protein [Thalictrum thalictroides]|uniref:Mln51-like protein n=1 Tax=Thalictrum thalictroides TaxID=46969 RepID=A0A7J6X0C6_THATH|nr:Mln51-like protein [Thalictrum thalictroides]
MVLEENMAVEGGGGREGEEEEEVEEYESDPEEAVLSLAMRRREASDDEEEEGDDQEKVRSRIDLRIEMDSEGDSDGQGGVEVYDDDEESEIEEEEEEEEEELVGVVEHEREFDGRVSEHGDNDTGKVQVETLEEGESGGDEQRLSGEQLVDENKEQEEGEKKENEPFAVPTAGAFYMHDDRFRENGGGRNRRTPGGKKLWESKDNRKWGHDKFEEMNLQEKQFEKEVRNTKGQYRGRGKNRGVDRRPARGNRSSAYDGRNTQSQPNQPVRTVRGRGPRRYEPSTRSNRETQTQNKQAGKSHESTSNMNPGRVFTNTRTSNVQSDSAPPRKHVFASSLNSASPPFYPSSSSSQDIPQNQKRELSGGNAHKNLRPFTTPENKMSTSHSTALLRGKNVANVAEKPYFDETPHTMYGKFSNLQLQSSGPLPMNTTQSPHMKPKGRGVAVSEQLSYQPVTSINQASRGSPHTQVSAVNQRPAQNTLQPSFRASSQQLGQHLNNASQASSPPKASPTSSSEQGEIESPPGSSKNKTALVGKGRGSVQGNGRGPFLYNGAQVMGASGSMGVSHGDQNFPPLLQVMQYGNQHGVAAVGMALPGYVAQPGFGNSEMTWVPVLAGAAGALGASYPLHLAVDGGYYSRPTGQTSSSAVSSKETSTSKMNNLLKAPERSEPVNDEFGQRQNKPRRQLEAFLLALCDLPPLLWSTLGGSVSQGYASYIRIACLCCG